MSYSFTTFDALTMHLLSAIYPRSVLDIGAGQGKYGQLIRQQGDLARCELVAVEYEEKLTNQLLTIGYNKVRCIGAMDLMNNPTETFDVVILGDVIEHMRKSEGQDLLEYLNYRCAYMFVITPESMPMNSSLFHEGHNSLWLPSSMGWHDLWAHARVGVMHFYLLRGMLPGSAVSLFDLVQDANLQSFSNKEKRAPPLHKPIHLTLHDTRSFDVHESDATQQFIWRVN